MFKKEELDASISYTKALEGARASPRGKLDIDKDGKLKIYKELLEKKHITLDAYIEKILEMYKFDALDLKKSKSRKENESSDESDDLNEETATRDISDDD